MKMSKEIVRYSLTKYESATRKSGVTISSRFFSSSASSCLKYRPFATSISDTLSPSQYEQNLDFVETESYRSEYRPYSTAISDTLSPSPFEQNNEVSELPSGFRPYATALSDIISPSEYEQNTYEKSENSSPIWSGKISFASPESDFSICDDIEFVTRRMAENGDFRSSMAYALAFATPESDFTLLTLTDEMRSQLKNAQEFKDKFRTRPLHLREKQGVPQTILPKTYEEALHESEEAIVVTECAAPFRIVSVNTAWEKLCGYSRQESVNESLGILQGPETDKAAITLLLSQILKGEEAGMVVTNYDKNKRKFQNRLTLGPLRDEENRITHFVGLLKEVPEEKKTMHS